MGVYYFYVNDGKKEYFCIDPTGMHIKCYALGHNVGSRALSYLLLESNPEYIRGEPHPRIGSWIGDRIFITGDDYNPDFKRIASEYADIGQAIIEMLVHISPFDLLQYGGVDWLLYLVEQADGQVVMTNDMRKRLSHAFRHENHSRPNDDLKKIIAALRLEM